RIESVIAHEYFHNWTGDRVTCRDWFQLSLKEGLTVYRDQIFTADMRDAAVKRIDDVRVLRARQFKEDDGPLAHPPRPASFIEIENFYTTTVYEKGAEICRMIERLVGKDGFRKGMDLYFQRHDGTAATVEDFIAALADANGRDFTQFARWYSQAGRPRVKAETHYDEAARAFDLTLSQVTAPTPGQPNKLPLHIPVGLGLLDEAGRDIPLRLEGEARSAAASTRILELKEPRATFRFVDLPRPQARSVLRGFSAPVTLEIESTAEEDAFLFAHDSDPFNRWEAGQRYARGLLFEGAKAWRAGKPLPKDPKFIEAMRRTLADQSLEPAYKSLALMLPTVLELAQAGDAPIDHEALYESRQGLRTEIGRALGDEFQRLYESELRSLGTGIDGESAGRRALANIALAYLVAADSARAPLAYAHYTHAKTMTDRMAALTILANLDVPEREKALADFYERFKNDGLVMEKWLRAQALSTRKQTLSEIKQLMSHPAFDIKNPNRVRSLIGAYAHSNLYRFYSDGTDGFDFLGDSVLKLDPINPKVAANMLSALESWRKLPPEQQAYAKATLARVKNAEGLSRNTFEIASKCLGED
ncbi:MAG TPA: aminopeptidase N, partial [Alphaproteobacteria bacterium]|nr:aminopeptidase N [Alphaproteobacteria bacterium]